MRRSFGSNEGPFGTAQDRNVPSYSRRRSKCRGLAACFRMTKRRAFDGTTLASSPDGSAVCEKSRMPWYLASFVAAMMCSDSGQNDQPAPRPHDPSGALDADESFREAARCGPKEIP